MRRPTTLVRSNLTKVLCGWRAEANLAMTFLHLLISSNEESSIISILVFICTRYNRFCLWVRARRQGCWAGCLGREWMKPNPIQNCCVSTFSGRLYPVWMILSAVRSVCLRVSFVCVNIHYVSVFLLHLFVLSFIFAWCYVFFNLPAAAVGK